MDFNNHKEIVSIRNCIEKQRELRNFGNVQFLEHLQRERFRTLAKEYFENQHSTICKY